MEDIVTSAQNGIVKLARSLAKRKFRLETGLILVEGINVLRDLPSNVRVKYLLSTPSRKEEARELLCKFEANDGRPIDFTRAQVYYIKDELMASISDTVSPYGIAAICKVAPSEFALPKGNALLLDGVADPGNVGTVLRTAAACGFNDVYLLECADLYSPKVIRASLGGVFRVRAYEVDTVQAMRLVRETNSVVLDMMGENILKNSPTCPVLYVAGNEAHGVRESIKESVKSSYALPMQGGIESLNVAVATAVAMYMTQK